MHCTTLIFMLCISHAQYVAGHFGSQKLKTLKTSLLTSSGSFECYRQYNTQREFSVPMQENGKVFFHPCTECDVFICVHTGIGQGDTISISISTFLWSLESTTSYMCSLMLDQFNYPSLTWNHLSTCSLYTETCIVTRFETKKHGVLTMEH